MPSDWSACYTFETPELLFDFIESTSMDNRDLIPQNESWSLNMLLRHVVDAEMQSYVRFMGMIAEVGSRIQNHDEALWTGMRRTMPLEEARSAVSFVRNQVCNLMKTYSGEELAAAYAVHSVRGKEYFIDLLEVYEGHIHTHLAQAQRISAACAG